MTLSDHARRNLAQIAFLKGALCPQTPDALTQAVVEREHARFVFEHTPEGHPAEHARHRALGLAEIAVMDAKAGQP